MRLHHLAFQAIGPFPGSHDIDFDALGTAGLFLLEGPTGSGKSTIIDAVVFALYGDVAGSQASEDRLASDFAKPGADPFVELVFSTATGVFRVTRSPRHERDKRRGSGRTTVNARATLTKLQAVDDVVGQSLGTGVADVNVQIQQAIGLSQQQFVQTVVLPQGEFATFLQSDADQRRDLLQRLFGTQVYSRVQSVLEQRRRDAKERLRGADHAVGTALAVFLAAARDDADADPTADPTGQPTQLTALERAAAEPGQDALVETALAERLAELEHQRGRCAEHHQRSRALTSAQRVALEELSRRHELAATKRGLLADQERLGKDCEVDARNRERLAAAQRHETVRGVLDGLADAERGLADAVEALAAAQQPLAPDVDPDAWRQERRRLTEQNAQLRAALDLEESLPDRSRRLEELVGLSTDAAEAHRSALDSQAALPGRITELETARATLRAHLAEEPERSRRRDDAQHRLAAAERQVTLSADARAERARLRLAVTRAKDAIATEGERRRRRLEGMAGELAGQLAPQAPCPVCGSTEHPRPATVGDQSVSAEQVERAEADRRGAEADAEVLRARVTSLEAEIARAEGEAGGATVDALRLEVAHAQAAVDEVSGDRARLTAIDQELDAAERRRHELCGVVERAEGASRAAAETTQRTRHDLERDLELVVRARGDHASVRDREAALRCRSDVLERALDAAEVLDVCRKDVEQRSQQVQRELARAEFPDRAAAERAALSEPERHRLAAAIEVRERTLTSIAERLADPAIAVIDDRAVIDVESAAEQLQQREAVQQQALASLTAAEESGRRAGEGAAAVRRALRARRREASATEPLIRVADIVAAASSVNARAMTLSTFVLIERFRDVVAAANHRLATMSDGRYTLAHIVDKEGQRRSGLGLVVNDIHTDRPRDPKTLSGGETFYCSLALALGLADVVTAESGGVSLETLFIDEGFGSLDAATLDLVLDVLARLSRSGRTVGVVSHVAELKERIAERIQVRRLPRGTSTLEVLA